MNEWEKQQLDTQKRQRQQQQQWQYQEPEFCHSSREAHWTNKSFVNYCAKFKGALIAHCSTETINSIRIVTEIHVSFWLCSINGVGNPSAKLKCSDSSAQSTLIYEHTQLNSSSSQQVYDFLSYCFEPAKCSHGAAYPRCSSQQTEMPKID